MDEIYLLPVNDYRNYLEHHGVKGQKWGVRNAEWYPIAAYQKSKGISAGPGPKTASSRTQSGRPATRAKGKDSNEWVNRAANPLAAWSQSRKERKEKAEAERKAAEKKAQQAARLEKARAAKEEKKRAEEEAAKAAAEKEAFEKQKKETFSHGTVEEILKYANIADSKEITDAIQRRQALDKYLSEQASANSGNTKLKSVVEKVSDRVIPVAKAVKPLAQNVGDAADAVTSAIAKSEKAVKAVKGTLVKLGLIEPSDSTNAVLAAAKKYQNTKQLANAIYDQVLEGKITLKEVSQYKKSLDDLKSIEKRANEPSPQEEKKAASEKKFTAILNQFNANTAKAKNDIKDIQEKNKAMERKSFLDAFNKKSTDDRVAEAKAEIQRKTDAANEVSKLEQRSASDKLIVAGLRQVGLNNEEIAHVLNNQISGSEGDAERFLKSIKS